MKKFCKVVTAGIVATSIAFTSLIVPAKAEAGFLDIAKGALNGLTGKEVNVNGLSHKHNNMIKHLNYSVLMLDAAFSNISNAAGMTKANATLVTKESVLKTAVATNSNAAFQMQKAAGKNKVKATEIKTQLASAMVSNDTATLNRIDSAVKEGNTERLLSNMLAGYAAAEAISIISETIVAFKNPKNNMDKIAMFVQTAKETQKLLKARSMLSKALHEATADYRKNRGIKDITKDEQKKALSGLTKG